MEASLSTIKIINELQNVEYSPPRFTPLQRLLAAILARALDDALHKRESYVKCEWVKKNMQKYRKSARIWLLEGNSGQITLEMVCAGIADNPEELQAEIVRMVKSGHDNGCLRAFGLDPNGHSFNRKRIEK